MRGKDTESALPMLNLLDMLIVCNIYSLHVLKFAHLWHKGLLPDVFRNTFQYASEVHSYNTRYVTPKILYKPRVRTNTGKQMISFKAIDLWKSVPQNLKDLKHEAILYNEAEVFSLSITNLNGRPMLPFDWLIQSSLILVRCHKILFSRFLRLRNKFEN